ncbi:MAG: ABC transporter substrate-binding protein [Oscillospiraceae bacterium]|nr:ABC transporter substrate-binding protein [Oscillospiraceae bacterium]
MKNFKRVIAVIMIAAMMLCTFAACGGNEASKEKVIFIGSTGPLTGDASSYGISVKNGAELAVKEINAAGGLNGIQLKFDMKDDKATAEDAATGYDALMDEGMQISIGSVTSGSCESFAAKSVADNLFFITPSASAANVIADRPNGFRICFGDPDQGILAAQSLTKTYKNIGCIYDTSDPYSSGIYDAFSAEMKNLNVDFLTQKFDAENKKDFSTQVEALKGCDVIFLPIYYTEAGLIAKACVAKGCNAVIYGSDGLDGVADQIDATVTNTIQYITPFDVNSTEPATANFVKAYKDAYGSAPDQFAADGYDAIYVIYNAMKAANITDADIEPSALCDAVVKAITDKSFSYTGATGTLSWDVSGACNKSLQVVTLEK